MVRGERALDLLDALVSVNKGSAFRFPDVDDLWYRSFSAINLQVDKQLAIGLLFLVNLSLQVEIVLLVAVDNQTTNRLFINLEVNDRTLVLSCLNNLQLLLHALQFSYSSFLSSLFGKFNALLSDLVSLLKHSSLDLFLL